MDQKWLNIWQFDFDYDEFEENVWYAPRSSPESCVVADGDSSNSFMCPSAQPLCLSCPSYSLSFCCQDEIESRAMKTGINI